MRYPSFDTVIFRIHDIKSFGEDWINFVKQKKVSVGGMRFFDLHNRYEETKETEIIKLELTSASYSIKYSINLQENYIHFDFSIPKYIYRHNLNSYPLDSKDLHGDLKNFILGFIMHEFKMEVQLKNIQIKRIDLCYNYEFESVKNKNLYKEILPTIFRSAFRENKILTYPNNDTVMYKTRDYSFKIYDKGVEFMKHDFKKLKGKIDAKELKKLVEKSAKTLRCELTFRERKISYDYFSNIKKSEQVSPPFKRKFLILQRYFLDSQSLLGSLTLRFNNYLNDKITYEQLIAYCEKIEVTDKYKKLCNKKVSFVVPMAKKIKHNSYDDIFRTEYFDTDFNSLLRVDVRARLDKYSKLTAPKKLSLDLEPLIKKFNYNYGNTEILFDIPTMDILSDKFTGIIDTIFNFKKSKVSPLEVLNYNRVKLFPRFGSLGGLKKYLAFKLNFSDGQIVKKNFLTDRSVRRYKATIIEINEFLDLDKENVYSLNSFDLPELMK